MIKLDDRDLKLLFILQREGRTTKNDLAKRINLSPTACWERLRHLEESGVIEGYGARVSLAAFGPSSIIMMQAELESHRSSDFDRFEAAIKDIPEIVECCAVGGGIDYFLKFVCKDIDSYQRLVDSMLDAEIGLKRYYTYVVTKMVKDVPTPPLEKFR
ncbi:MAG: Lrp/AsnC family transcriptional regulator [Alphaproteobacteria bacterium]